jgi:hypothetical protein
MEEPRSQSPSGEDKGEATSMLREQAAVKLATTRGVWDAENFLGKFRPLIEQLLAKAKASVCNYRWKPKRDPGDVAKFTNLTRGKIDQLVGLSEFIVKMWNSDSPPFLIKTSLSFSLRGHVYCDACKFTYVHLHKDYVKFIEHFTCVSHLARCRDLGNEATEEHDEMASDKTESCLHTFAHFVTSQLPGSPTCIPQDEVLA